jgi:glycosyltransferase involved in cell wall biosynthesis
MPRQVKNSYAGAAEKIRILHVLSAKNKRIRPFENLVNGLDKSIFSQVVCYLRGADEEHTELETSGHDVLTLDISQKKLRAFQPLAVLQLAKIMKERGIDIIHCQRHKPTVYGILAAYIKGKDLKVISHVRGLGRTRSFRRKLLNKALFRRISRIIAVSDAVRDDIVRTNSMYFPDKVVTIYNGIDVKPFMDPNLTREEARIGLGLPEKDAFVYGTVGRLAETKGQSVLLNAFARLHEKYPESWLILAGKGRLESELRSLAVELNIHPRVVFLGYRTDILAVLKACDVFVLPSIAEGLPGALLEAMATGIPVIASRVGGVPEILNNPELGMMISPSSVGELTTAMERLYNMDEVERNAIGKILRERVLAQFTKEKMISVMTREYFAVMKKSMSQ